MNMRMPIGTHANNISIVGGGSHYGTYIDIIACAYAIMRIFVDLHWQYPLPMLCMLI